MSTNDNHTELLASQKSSFGGIPWPQCPFHIQQNALAAVALDAMKAEGTHDIKAIANAPDMHYAIVVLKQNETKAESNSLQACGVDRHSKPESLTVMQLP